MNYILNEKGEPVPEPDLMKWAKWFERNQKHVALDKVGHSEVSTVFLGIDHSFNGPPPVLWETMVFNGPMNGEEDRCSGNREQAEAMHARMLARVKAAIKGKP